MRREKNGPVRPVCRRRFCLVFCSLLIVQFLALSAFAQNFSGDAREIGLGGVGETGNISAKMIAPSRSYRAIMFPLGVIQAVRNRDRFRPDSADFDPAFALEYAASPLHYTLDRGPSGTAARFVHDIVNGTINRDLSFYSGFVPARELVAEGLASPSYGYTFKFAKDGERRFHGVYFGVGPYLSLRTALDVDQQLRDLLSAPPNSRLTNASLSITDDSGAQAALAVTAGYRTRIGLPGSAGKTSSQRDGIYFAANYHYLRGYRYDTANMRFRFDTDSAGLITLNPTTTPAVIDHLYSSSGTGYAMDFGMGAVIDRWQFGLGANGVGNRIDWKDFNREQFTLQSLVTGGAFVRQPVAPGISEVQVRLPVNYTGNVSYDAGPLYATADISHGFQGLNFHGGVEKRLSRIEFRGGGRFSRDRWHPTGGLGLNLIGRLSIDVAAFGSSTNIQSKERVALAASIRLNRTVAEAK